MMDVTKPWPDQTIDEKLDSLRDLVLKLAVAANQNGVGNRSPFNAQHTYTYEEAAIICHRATRTIKNLVSRHRIPHKVVRGPGSKRIYIALLQQEGLAKLRQLTIGM